MFLLQVRRGLDRQAQLCSSTFHTFPFNSADQFRPIWQGTVSCYMGAVNIRVLRDLIVLRSWLQGHSFRPKDRFQAWCIYRGARWTNKTAAASRRSYWDSTSSTSGVWVAFSCQPVEASLHAVSRKARECEKEMERTAWWSTKDDISSEEANESSCQGSWTWDICC